ncbi:MAG: tRNA lysidine(34) synthetase TilS [Treponema sp.]|nr:tRNA lysidine(34) synthetase TilS [Treponema sp.]
MEIILKSIQKELSRFYEKNILVCVSGGIDSMVLLHLVVSQKIKFKLNIFVVTVNHNIRSTEETLKDFQIIKEFCDSLNIPYIKKEIPVGMIKKTALERNRGEEESARFLRYKCFEQAAKECNADIVLTAHTFSDQVETLLQRFLQGSDSESFTGIKKQRDIFFRPLLNVDRQKIEEYAKIFLIPFHEDLTNQNNNYLRNKIRNKLIPFLNENFFGWEKAVVTGAKKIAQDGNLLKNLSKKIIWQKKIDKDNQVFLFCNKEEFIKYPLNIKVRALKNALRKLNCTERISTNFLEKFAVDFKFCKTSGFIFDCKKEKVFIKKRLKIMTNKSFFAIIEKDNGFEIFSNYEKNERE